MVRCRCLLWWMVGREVCREPEGDSIHVALKFSLKETEDDQLLSTNFSPRNL